jgi:hypothetical protein
MESSIPYWFKRGLPEQPQANESNSPEFRILMVRPVYLLRLLGLLSLTNSSICSDAGWTCNILYL